MTAIISITNPGERAPLREGWDRVLRIQFIDAGYNNETIAFFGPSWRASSRGFPEKRHALAIRAFLGELPPSIETLFVHCHAGVSRSGAVAKYVAERFGLPFHSGYDRYNETVYRLLLDPCLFDAVLAAHRPPPPTIARRVLNFLWR